MLRGMDSSRACSGGAPALTKRLLSLAGVRHAVNRDEHGRVAPAPGGRRHRRATRSSGCIDAAADAFADKGFHATTTRDIASRAGLSPAGVYVHFASKEDAALRTSAAAATTPPWRSCVAAAAEARTTPTGALARDHGGVRRVARRALPGRPAIVQYEFPHLTPEHRDARARAAQGHRRRGARGARRPASPAATSTSTTLQSTALALHVARHRRRPLVRARRSAAPRSRSARRTPTWPSASSAADQPRPDAPAVPEFGHRVSEFGRCGASGGWGGGA